MIEIIALTAAAVLVVSLAAFAWVSKKRIDELQDDVFALSDEIDHIRFLLNQPPFFLRKPEGE